IGKTFDTRNGNPLSPGSISGVSWYQGAVTGSIGVVAYGSPGATLGFILVSGVAPYAFNAASAAIPVATGAQFVGLALYGGVFGSVGMRSASTNGQGFHGHVRNFFGGGYVVLSGQNAMVRVSGSVIVPVELMEFELE
ncbi:MAG: hypothetical protein O7A04_05305, partial [Acidobacteria bacterium]|nr:hypothetical protein [Acidobacteriota bacterium]